MPPLTHLDNEISRLKAKIVELMERLEGCTCGRSGAKSQGQEVESGPVHSIASERMRRVIRDACEAGAGGGDEAGRGDEAQARPLVDDGRGVVAEDEGRRRGPVVREDRATALSDRGSGEKTWRGHGPWFNE